MKNSVKLIVVIIFVSLFASCQKDLVVESGLVRDDNPPKEMFQYSQEYGMYTQVYLEEYDINNAVYFYNLQTGETYSDGNGLIVRFTQDYYRVLGSKYWGPYKETIRISRFKDDFIISARDLDIAKKTILRKGSAIADLGSNNLSSYWKTIYNPR